MSKKQIGFSLIELLLVVTIVGIIAIIAIPHLQKAVGASRNTNTFATLKSISSTQVGFFSNNNRFARLDELSALSSDAFGQFNASPPSLTRGFFTIAMSPSVPTDAELRYDYQIIATKGNDGTNTPCVLSLDATGVITEIFGTNCIDNN